MDAIAWGPVPETYPHGGEPGDYHGLKFGPAEQIRARANNYPHHHSQLASVWGFVLGYLLADSAILGSLGKYTDGSGVKRFQGKKKELRASQRLALRNSKCMFPSPTLRCCAQAIPCWPWTASSRGVPDAAASSCPT